MQRVNHQTTGHQAADQLFCSYIFLRGQITAINKKNPLPGKMTTRQGKSSSPLYNSFGCIWYGKEILENMPKKYGGDLKLWVSTTPMRWQAVQTAPSLLRRHIGYPKIPRQAGGILWNGRPDSRMSWIQWTNGGGSISENMVWKKPTFLIGLKKLQKRACWKKNTHGVGKFLEIKLSKSKSFTIIDHFTIIHFRNNETCCGKIGVYFLRSKRTNGGVFFGRLLCI